MTEKFKVRFLKEGKEFLNVIETKAREKIIYNITKAKFTNDIELFKKITDDIWEFRTYFKKRKYRLFAFWDKSDNTETLVVITHGIIKTTGKTPAAELTKADRDRKKYFEMK